jgi:PhnB protein
MQLNPYVHFDGRCAEAFQFYRQTVDDKIEMLLKYEAMPSAEHVPVEWRGKIGHAHLTVGDQMLMGRDAPPSV